MTVSDNQQSRTWLSENISKLIFSQFRFPWWASVCQPCSWPVECLSWCKTEINLIRCQSMFSFSSLEIFPPASFRPPPIPGLRPSPCPACTCPDPGYQTFWQWGHPALWTSTIGRGRLWTGDADVAGAVVGLSHHTGRGGGGYSEDYRGTQPSLHTFTTVRGIALQDTFILVWFKSCFRN